MYSWLSTSLFSPPLPSLFCLSFLSNFIDLQTKVLTAIFSLPHGEFLSIWCSSELPPREEDATLEYDLFTAAGWVLDTFSSLNLSNASDIEIILIPSNMPQAAYAHQRTSLFVKVIANLHCFVPNICEGQLLNVIWNFHYKLDVPPLFSIAYFELLSIQSRREIFSFTSSLSACEWIHLNLCLDFLLLLVLTKPTLFAGTCVSTSLPLLSQLMYSIVVCLTSNLHV